VISCCRPYGNTETSIIHVCRIQNLCLQAAAVVCHVHNTRKYIHYYTKIIVFNLWRILPSAVCVCGAAMSSVSPSYDPWQTYSLWTIFSLIFSCQNSLWNSVGLGLNTTRRRIHMFLSVWWKFNQWKSPHLILSASNQYASALVTNLTSRCGEFAPCEKPAHVINTSACRIRSLHRLTR